MINSRKFSVPPGCRQQIESMFNAMLHAPSKEQILSCLQTFEQYAPAFSKCFDSNWTYCNNMWANYGHRRCFPGGNTTMNRVEPGWNQLEQLLGKQSSIDSSPVERMRELSSLISFFSAYPPVVDALPSVLQQLQTVMSTYTLSKVRQQ
ncbi:hypothetical protein PHMEG_0008703 [Phytophthora megakarya]|uniref:Uncharacterized protein n=1 Tax=Phytophthora megakarya TaxID=4795 RepID=A0A225WIB5_9STRA|nr:hypothetical protein PHMEG_0008703 [Phytophthora megakarya]